MSVLRRTLATLAVTGLTAAGSVVALTPAPASADETTTSLAEVLAADGNKLDRDQKDFDVLDKNMLGRDAHSFFRYQQGTLDMQEEPIPAYALDALQVKITPAAIYVLKKTGLEVYARQL